MVLTCIYEKIGIINWKLANYVKIWQGFDVNPHYEVCVSVACDKGVFAVFSRIWACTLNYGLAVLHCDILSLQCKKSAWASGLWGVGVLLGETFDRCGAEARCMLGFGWVQRVLQMNKRPVKVYRPLLRVPNLITSIIEKHPSPPLPIKYLHLDLPIQPHPNSLFMVKKNFLYHVIFCRGCMLYSVSLDKY